MTHTFNLGIPLISHTYIPLIPVVPLPSPPVIPLHNPLSISVSKVNQLKGSRIAITATGKGVGGVEEAAVQVTK